MTLFKREFRSQTKLTEMRTGWVISAAVTVYLITADHPEPDALRIMLGGLAFVSMSVAMNSFGLDGVAGLDRFLLWPIKSAQIITAKNRAFSWALGAPILLLCGLAAWRFGWREGAANLLEAAAIVLSVLGWGNIASVRHPESSAVASGGNILDQFVAMAAVALPTAASVGVLRSGSPLALLYLIGLASFSSLAYLASIRWSAKFFENRYEQMRRQLT